MKIRNLQVSLASLLTGVIVSLSGLWAGKLDAQNATTTPDGNIAPPLSFGVEQVADLTQAQVNEGTIINYVQGSGISYSLKADDIIYLKQQGVSDAVLKAMLNQRTASTPSTTTINNTYVTTPPAVIQPAITYVQPAPVSSVIIIPDTQTARYHRWYYNHANGFRYGNGFDGWAYSVYPVTSISIGYGSHRNHFHGGWHH